MTIWTQSNGGETTTFWSCGICGASVQPMDKETHEKWHARLRKSLHMNGCHGTKEL